MKVSVETNESELYGLQSAEIDIDSGRLVINVNFDNPNETIVTVFSNPYTKVLLLDKPG